jgi:hypothetical protein
MNRREKLQKLQDLVIDKYIEVLEDGSLKPMELQAVVTFLKNNKVIESEKIENEDDNYDSMVEDLK